MRLRWQLAITLAILAGAAATAASVAAFRSTSAQLSADTDAFLQQRLDEVTASSLFFNRDDLSFGPFGGDGGFSFGGPGFPFVRPDANTNYLNADGTSRGSLTTVDIALNNAELIIAATGTGQTIRDVTTDDGRYRVLTAPLDDGDPTAGAVQLSRDTTETQNLLARLRWRLTALTSIVTVTAAAVGWLIARRLARPLEHLRDAARAVAETKTFDTQLPTQASGEVGEVTQSFNTMLTELDDARRRQQRLVQDANHELRTPLATLSANLELLERQPLGSAEDAAILGEARAELGELTNLVDQLTTAASVQYSRSTRTLISIEHLAAAAMRDFQNTSDRLVDFDVASPATVHVAQDIVTRAIVNLLANADKYSPSVRPITISINDTCLSVRDQGPGINPEDMLHLFEPFYRAETARTQPGSGLGLALVKQIVDDHDAKIDVSNHPDGGAQFTITF